MNDRSYRCEGCGGTVSVPKYSRTTLEAVKAVHEPDCPGRAFIAKKTKKAAA